MGVIDDFPLLYLANLTLEQDIVHGKGAAVDQKIHLGSNRSIIVASVACPMPRLMVPVMAATAAVADMRITIHRT